MPRRCRDRSLTLAIWRHAFETLRGPPLASAFKQLRELGERHRADLDIQFPDAQAAPKPPQRRRQRMLLNAENPKEGSLLARAPRRPRSGVLLIARATDDGTTAATNRKNENITTSPRVFSSYRFLA